MCSVFVCNRNGYTTGFFCWQQGLEAAGPEPPTMSFFSLPSAKRWAAKVTTRPAQMASSKVTGVAEAIHAADSELLYLPPYSPDLNPIEKLWSKIKSCVRRAGPRRLDELINAIGEAFRRVKREECASYFRSCGYATYDR